MTACFKLTHIADILSTQIYYFSIDGEFLHINQMSVDVFTKWWLYNWGDLIKPRHLNSKLNYTVHSQVTANATIFCWGVKRFWRVRLCVINQPQECFLASHLGLYEILSDTRRNYASHNNIHLLHSCFLSSSWIKNPTFLNNLSNPG